MLYHRNLFINLKPCLCITSSISEVKLKCGVTLRTSFLKRTYFTCLLFYMTHDFFLYNFYKSKMPEEYNSETIIENKLLRRSEISFAQLFRCLVEFQI